MSRNRQALGAWGEELAAEHLRANGFEILARNLRCGRIEIDIVARERDTLCFVEVRTRRGNRYGTPEESVDARKQRQLIRGAGRALREHRFPRHRRLRFDVVAIYAAESPPRIRLIRDAF